MKKINDTQDFTRTVEVAQVELSPGNYHIDFKTALRTSQHPDNYRREYAISVTREGLKALKDEISECLNTTQDHS